MTEFNKAIECIDKINVPASLKAEFIAMLSKFDAMFEYNDLEKLVNINKFFEENLYTDTSKNPLKVYCIDYEDVKKDQPNFMDKNLNDKAFLDKIIEKAAIIKFEESFKFLKSSYQYDKTQCSKPQVISENGDVLVENCYGYPLFISSEYMQSKIATCNLASNTIIINKSLIKDYYENHSLHKIFFSQFEEFVAYTLGHEFSHFLTLKGDLEIKTAKGNALVTENGKLQTNGQLQEYKHFSSNEFHLMGLKELYAEYLTNKTFSKKNVSGYRFGSSFLPFIEYVYGIHLLPSILTRSYEEIERAMGEDFFKKIFASITKEIMVNDGSYTENFKETIKSLLGVYHNKIKVIGKDISVKDYINIQTELMKNIPFAFNVDIKQNLLEINKTFVTEQLKNQNIIPSEQLVKKMCDILAEATKTNLTRIIEDGYGFEAVLPFSFGDNRFIFAKNANKLFLADLDLINNHERYLGFKMVEDISDFNNTKFNINLHTKEGKICFEKQENQPIKISLIKNQNPLEKENTMYVNVENDMIIIQRLDYQKNVYMGKSRKLETIRDIDLIFENELKINVNKSLQTNVAKQK